MQDALMVYFDGEKNAGLLLAGIAVAVLIAAAIMFRARLDLRSFAVTLGVLAVAQMALGVGLYLRTDPQVIRLVEQLRSDATGFHSTERARMTRVQRNFIVVEYVELLIIIVTAATAVFQKTRPGLAGVALGLLISASLLLAFDLVAERRGAGYLASLDDGEHSH